MLKKTIDVAYQLLLLAVGSVLCAVAVRVFVMPHGFLSRGLTGFALLICYLHPKLPVGGVVFLLNIPVFALGWRFVGRRFVGYSLLGMTMYSLALSLIRVDVFVEDPMLCAVIAGALSGIGMAIILRSYGSPGGSEILCVIMHKLFSITIGTGSILINAILLILSLWLFSLEQVLYTLVFVFVSTLFVDKVFHGLAKRRTVLIMSERGREIAEVLTGAYGLGATILTGKGGFQGADRTLLYSVVQRKDVSRLKRVVHDIDAQAFITIMEADDVTGVEVGNQPHW